MVERVAVSTLFAFVKGGLMEIKYVIKDILYAILAIIVILAFLAVLPFVVCGFVWVLTWFFKNYVDYFIWVIELLGLSDVML